MSLRRTSKDLNILQKNPPKKILLINPPKKILPKNPPKKILQKNPKKFPPPKKIPKKSRQFLKKFLILKIFNSLHQTCLFTSEIRKAVFKKKSAIFTLKSSAKQTRSVS